MHAPNTLPFSKYQAFITLKKVGLTYDVIDVCVKGCMLFWGECCNLNLGIATKVKACKGAGQE